jgi:hypothetical protein
MQFDTLAWKSFGISVDFDNAFALRCCKSNSCAAINSVLIIALS